MNLSDMKHSNDLAYELERTQKQRNFWANIALTGTDAIPACINTERHRHNLPEVASDETMHSILVQTIVTEYDRRIHALEAELSSLGVDIAQ